MPRLEGGWITGEQDTVTGALERTVRAHPDRTFLDFAGEEFSFRDLDENVNRIAHGLRELGVERGQTVGTILDNSPDAVFLWLAINRLGGISVPVNTAYKGVFLQHVLADAGARVVVAEADYVERVGLIEKDLPDLKTVLHRGDRPDVKVTGPELVSLEDVRTDDTGAIPDENRPQDLACLIYTGGTTGPSKGCMVSHNYMCNLARQWLLGSGRTPDEPAWTALPVFHINATATTILSSIMIGGKACIYSRFSLSNFWPEIERTGANIATVLGAMIAFVAQADDSPEMKSCYGQLRVVRGAPFTAELQRIWKDRFGVKIAGSNAYGLSEASLVTMLEADEDAPEGSSGKRAPEFDVRIVDDEDNEVPANETGEIIVRPLKPHVMFEGYWRRPEATLEVLKNLWFHTGDIGKFDSEGFFYFVDRKKDYLRRRGENISSFEMESTFLSHPDIAEVAVHAVFSEYTEDDVKVTAVRKSGSDLSEEQFFRWAMERVPYFALPRYIEFRKELPKNPVGRVLKFQLRDDGKTSGTWDMDESDIKVVKR